MLGRGLRGPVRHQDGAATGAVPGLDVPFAVPDHPRASQVNVMQAGSIEQHTRFRFAAIARVSVVRAVEDIQNIKPVFVPEKTSKSPVHVHERLFSHEPQGHSPLVGDNEGCIATLRGHAQSVHKVRHQVEVFPALDVARPGRLVDNAVAIEKYARPHGCEIRSMITFSEAGRSAGVFFAPPLAMVMVFSTKTWLRTRPDRYPTTRST